MSGMAIGVFAAFAMVAGFVWQFGVPKLQPMLPAVFSTNAFARALATGVFIIGTVWVAYATAKALGQGKRAPVRT